MARSNDENLVYNFYPPKLRTTMNADSALEAFASISVGVAGFSAVVVALSANTVFYDGRRLSWALGIIFGWSLGAMLFSVLPYIFQFFGMTELQMWQVGLFVMGGFVAVVGTVISYKDYRLNQIGVDMVGKVHDKPARRSIEITTAIILCILASSTAFAPCYAPNLMPASEKTSLGLPEDHRVAKPPSPDLPARNRRRREGSRHRPTSAWQIASRAPL